MIRHYLLEKETVSHWEDRIVAKSGSAVHGNCFECSASTGA